MTKSARKTVSGIRRQRLAQEGLDTEYLGARGKYILGRLAFYSLVLGLCFAILYPLLKTIPTVLNDFAYLDNPDVIWVPLEFSVLSFTAAIRVAFGNGSTVLYTVLYCLVIAFIQIVVSAISGYSLGRVDFPFRNAVMAMVFIVIIVPPQALLISQYLRFKQFDIFGIISMFNNGRPLDLVNQPYTLYILALFGFGVKECIFIFIFRQFFKGLPMELEEAALIDGCGFYRTFARIAFPNAVPAIMTVLALAFVWNYGDTYYTGYFHPDGFYIANNLNRVFAESNMQTLTANIGRVFNLPYTSTFVFDAVKYAAALLYLAPLLVMYFATQKKIVDNFERSGIVG